MRIVRNPRQMQAIAQRLNRRGKVIGFVPTMGALHEGHFSLIRRAVRENDTVIVSIFVNPIQFGPREDLARYPRSLHLDTAACTRLGVDFLFCPEARRMYPDDFKTYVTVSGVSDVLCGAVRPGHFQGVATVITKLFNIILPHRAYFGQKDAQQAVIIRALVRDLAMPVKVVVLPVVREISGLALSSRNRYLSAKEKNDARVLHAALCLARAMMKQGVRDSRGLIRAMRKKIMSVKPKKIDYLAVVDAQSLQPVSRLKTKTLVALAVWIGKTRLIDNIVVHC